MKHFVVLAICLLFIHAAMSARIGLTTIKTFQQDIKDGYLPIDYSANVEIESEHQLHKREVETPNKNLTESGTDDSDVPGHDADISNQEDVKAKLPEVSDLGRSNDEQEQGQGQSLAPNSTHNSEIETELEFVHAGAHQIVENGVEEGNKSSANGTEVSLVEDGEVVDVGVNNNNNSEHIPTVTELMGVLKNDESKTVKVEAPSSSSSDEMKQMSAEDYKLYQEFYGFHADSSTTELKPRKKSDDLIKDEEMWDEWRQTVDKMVQNLTEYLNERKVCRYENVQNTLVFEDERIGGVDDSVINNDGLKSMKDDDDVRSSLINGLVGLIDIMFEMKPGCKHTDKQNDGTDEKTNGDDGRDADNENQNGKDNNSNNNNNNNKVIYKTMNSVVLNNNNDADANSSDDNDNNSNMNNNNNNNNNTNDNKSNSGFRGTTGQSDDANNKNVNKNDNNCDHGRHSGKNRYANNKNGNNNNNNNNDNNHNGDNINDEAGFQDNECEEERIGCSDNDNKCIDVMRHESVVSQLCTKMAAIERGRKCVTSQVKSNKQKADDEIAGLREEVSALKMKLELLQRSSIFFAEAPFGSSRVTDYNVKVVQGDGFEPTSGFFVAPFDGAYQVTVGYLKKSQPKSGFLVNVMLNNNTIFRMFATGSDQQRMFMTSLQAGQSLYVETNGANGEKPTTDNSNETVKEDDVVYFGAVLVK